MDTRSISISDYTYTLPEDRIARYPLPERDASRLLVYQQGSITEDIYRNIGHYLPPASLLVFNNTRVLAARLLFRKPSGGTIEIFCLEPGDEYAGLSIAMEQTGAVYWKCLIGGASKWKPGQVLQKNIPYNGSGIVLEARYLEKQDDCFRVELRWVPAGLSFAAVLEEAGVIPLPPYIKRPAELSDKERYQTVYARQDGSVAAPTAGLHFTPVLLGKLEQQQFHSCFITLHVGAGTFKPVKSPTMESHEMHAEFMDVPATAIRQLLQFETSIIAVGTTSARTLESLYWMGVKAFGNPLITAEQLAITQWEVYDRLEEQAIPRATALEALLKWMARSGTQRLISKTKLLIAPGYPFKIISGLATNFHQPQSTLLLLVAALAGTDWKKMYAYALENDFRFLSYGDGCLILAG
ncbi:MAG: S-adenosylmethionine:tRNA ribosyltransferase-isomerase [Bacteroidota bacterium]